MKIGTHNLGTNGFSNMTLAKLEAGKLTLRQTTQGGVREISLSANQIALLKEVLA